MHITPDFDLTGFNTFGLPATARFGATLASRDDLIALADFARGQNLPLHIIGGGSNLLLQDRIEAVVGIMAMRGRSLSHEKDGTAYATAAAGEDWNDFVAWTVAQGAPGLENLALIPGTVGAAPVQNIGAYGVELADRFVSLTAWDLQEGRERLFTQADCGFAYRQSIFKQSGGRYVVLDVTVALPPDWTPVLTYPGLDTLPADSTAETVRQTVIAVRQSKLPDWRVIGNAGSFFHNPIVSPDLAATIAGGPRYPQADGTIKLSAAWLIDQCGLKGFRLGNAGVYASHALILVNHGGARYADIAALSSHIRDSVMARFGVALTQEPIIL